MPIHRSLIGRRCAGVSVRGADRRPAATLLAGIVCCLLLAAAIQAQPPSPEVVGAGAPLPPASPTEIKSVKAKRSGDSVEVRVGFDGEAPWTSTVRPDGIIQVAFADAVGKGRFRTLSPRGDVVETVITRPLAVGEERLVQIEIRPDGTPLEHSVARTRDGLTIYLERTPSAEAPAATGTMAPAPGITITEGPALEAPAAQAGVVAAPADAPATPGAPGAMTEPVAEDPVPTVVFPYSPEVGRYRIGPGDTLSLDVFGISELKREVQVGPDGRIALPILGRLEVEGKTLEEAESAIAEVLQQRSPATSADVCGTVSRYESHGVFVQGAVAQPGIVQIPGGKRVMELLSEVGGLAQRDPAGQRIFILRTGADGQARKMVIDAAQLLAQGDFSLNVLVLPGDLVLVPEPSRVQVFVSGAVQNPGPVEIANGTGLTVLQAITAAGGPTPRAKLADVSIIRRHLDGTQETIDVNVKKIRNGNLPDIPLQNGDSVVVKEWFF